MEQQVLHLLKASQLSAAQPRTAAEEELKKLYNNEAFPAALVTIGTHQDIPVQDRLAALLSLKNFVNVAWSPSLEDYAGSTLISDQIKEQVRNHLLSIVYDGQTESKISSITGNVIAVIAKSDFPEEWPGLLESLLNHIGQGTDDQIQAILIVLGELILNGLDEDQFYQYATALVNVLHGVATNGSRKLMVRAHATNVFRSCFDFLENLKDKDEHGITHFAKGLCDSWSPFFLRVVKEPMPQLPSVDEDDDPNSEIASNWRGVVALKVQIILALARIQTIFPHLMASHEFFKACWDSIQAHGVPYYVSYIDGERQGGLINQYQLQYTLDFLVIEEIDYLQTLLEANQVKQQLDAMIAADTASSGGSVAEWLSSVLGTLVTFSNVTKEAEEMWSIDFNVFLSEETFAETNNSPRSACAGFVWKICNWLPAQTLESLLGYIKMIFEDSNATWRQKEAALYTLQQVAEEFENENRTADPNAVRLSLEFAETAMSDFHELLRARGHITVAAILVAWLGGSGNDEDVDLVLRSAHRSLSAIENDDSDIVKTACIRIMRDYLTTLPSSKSTEMQPQVVNSIAKFLSSQNLGDMDENADLIDVVLQTLRDTIMANPATCLDHNALDVLIMMVKYGAARDDHSAILIDEAFECVTEAMAKKGAEDYAKLCFKIMPSLMAAFDVEDPTTKEKTALTDVSANMLKLLAQNARTPLPPGFVAAAMPRLCRIIFSDTDFYVKQLTTLAIKNMLTNDKDQVFNWIDPQLGKNGLEMCFMIIGHLLGPTVDEVSAAEVGELANSVVEQAGAAALGGSMEELIRVLAQRLYSAEHLMLIQSLTSVFARLSLISASEVINFLSTLPIHSTNALTVVMTKWLENSTGYVGFEAIRQNTAALIAVYRTHDARIAAIECNGDLVPDTSTRIKTRSMAKNQPIRFTRVSAVLKILKNLVAELLPYGDPNTAFGKPLKSPGLGIGARTGNSDGSWESDDEGSTGSVLGSIFGAKSADDTTQQMLMEFFSAEGVDPQFQALYAELTEEEKKRCMDAVAGWEKRESQRGLF